MTHEIAVVEKRSQHSKSNAIQLRNLISVNCGTFFSSHQHSIGGKAISEASKNEAAILTFQSKWVLISSLFACRNIWKVSSLRWYFLATVQLYEGNFPVPKIEFILEIINTFTF